MNQSAVPDAPAVAVRQAALDFLARGWSVMPILRTESKKPAVRWKALQTRLPTQTEIDTWFARTDRNVGIITGALSGFFALDIDDESGWRAIEAHGGVPVTVQTRSRAGREQLWFRHPGGHIANAQKFLPGLDLRGDGGYVQAPPSLHYTGSVYQFINHPDDTPLADAPAWLLGYARKTTKELETNSAPLQLAALNGHAPENADKAYVWAALCGEAAKVSKTSEGERHGQRLRSAIAVAGFIHTGCVTAQEIEDNLFINVGKDNKNALQTIRDGIAYGEPRHRQIPKREPSPRVFLRGARARTFIETGEIEEAENEADVDPLDAKDESGVYGVENGQIVFYAEHGKENDRQVRKVVVADFAAQIAEEIIPEEGAGSYRVIGRAKRGGYFEAEISIDEFSDEKRLLARMEAAAGPRSPVLAGMTKHLRPAIKKLTSGAIARTRAYERTGWASEGVFLLPGRQYDGLTVTVGDPPYGLNPDADLATGLKTLAALMEIQPPRLTTVAATLAFQAPLAHLMGWRNERYGLFITGQTGSLKTTWTQILASLYGPEFLDDSNLLKWGDGGTRNAIGRIVTIAHDMMVVIDNFKPNTGRGAEDFVSIMHNILEGAEKRRLDRFSKLVGKRPIFCWPIVTGEDVPEEDAASLARVVTVHFPKPLVEDSRALTQLFDDAPHLSAVGLAWIEWLESQAARDAAKEARGMFPAARNEWRANLSGKEAEMANPWRVATNLASNDLTWWVMNQCPALSAFTGQYWADHTAGLEEISGAMATQTTESREADKFLAVLRQLLVAERAVILPYGTAPKPEDRDRVIGWWDSEKENVLLQRDVARQAVEKVLGPNGLNRLSSTALAKQLKQANRLAGHDDDRLTKKARPSGPSDSYIYVKGELFA